MTNTEMIISAITGKTGKDSDQICCLCGGNRTIEGFMDRKKVLSGNFMDYNLMKMKSSQVICDFCRLALSDDLLPSPKGKKCGLRLYSFLVENSLFKIIEQDERIYYLFEHDFSIPFILAFTGINYSVKNGLVKFKGGKKHISYKAIINNNSNQIFTISTDKMNILFDRQLWYSIFKIANHFYQQNCSKAELLNCYIPPWKFNKYDLNLSNYKIIRQIKNTEQYKLIIALLTKNGENR